MKKTNMKFYTELAHKADDLINDFDTISYDEFYDRSSDLLEEFNEESIIIREGKSEVIINYGHTSEYDFIKNLHNLLSLLVKHSSNRENKLNSFLLELLQEIKDDEFY